jgi:class 3 adenylate cyclase
MVGPDVVDCTMAGPTTRYATTADGLSIAYQDLGGSGPPVVWLTGTASHVELLWEVPGWANLIRRLSSVCHFVWFDKRGAGLSDRTLGSGSLEDRTEDIRAVMDAVGFETAVIIGSSESGAIAALFAATHPERVDQLVMFGAWAHAPALGDSADLFQESWGEGLLMSMIWAQGMDDLEHLGRIERAMGTPTGVAALVRVIGSIDVRPVLPLVTVPTLVVHCTGDPIVPIEHAREVASLLPHATFVEIDAAFHMSARPADTDLLADAIEEFVVGRDGRSPHSVDRVLATVLFTDIVGSTDQAAALGDTRWAALLDDHDRVCAHAVEHGRGRIVKMTGDGLLATFDGPASAIAAAHRMIDQLGRLGVHLRAGVHTGEVERRGEDIGGIGVNLAARVMGAAADDEVWVSSTVPGLTVGAPIEFAPMGAHDLKGIPGRWDLYAAKLTAATR